MAGGVIGLVAVTVALSRLEARPPSVARGEIIIDSVSRGELIRNVRAPGSLVPENIRYVAAVTGGRVEQRPLRPGAAVKANTVILVLSNPDEQLQLLEAQRQLSDAQQNLVTLRSNLESGRLAQESAIATLNTQLAQAKRDLATAQALDKKNLSSPNELQAAQDLVTELTKRVQIEQQRLDLMKSSADEQINGARSNIERTQAVVQFRRDRIAALNVTAGIDGQLQSLNLEDGQWVNSGQELARVAQPGRFKAVLRVPETQAKDVAVGQKVTIDLRPDTVMGHVVRVDPVSTNATVEVEVALDGKMPESARSDLSVDGIIEIDRLEDVMYVQRPAYGQAESTVGLFKLEPDGKTAVRVNVKLGRASVNQIEVVSGLQPGDRIIVSDMSNMDNTNKVRIN
jgi:multidrug resistance efflux pump